MKKRVVQALGCILAMTMVVGSLTACGGKSEKKAEKKAGSDVKVAIICSAAGQNDNGYNQSAVEGAKKAADEFGIEYKVVEPTTGVPQALESLADDANKDDQQPGYVLTSVIKNTEVPVYDIVKEAVNGKIDKMDRAQTYSLASGAASITDLSEISKHIQDSGKDKWEEIKTEIKDVEDKISDGTIVVTDAQSGEEFDASKCPNVTVK